MKEKTSENQVDELEKDFERLRKEIESDERRREKLLKQIEESPNEKNQELLTRLDESIAEKERQLSSVASRQIQVIINNVMDDFIVMVKRQDEEELLRLGDDAPVMGILESLQKRRNEIYDSDYEYAKEFAGCLITVIEKLKEKIEEKRKLAAAHFPELARSLKPREYEMPADYIEYLNFFMKQIELRDKFAKDLQFATPEQRREILLYLSEMDKLIDEGEQKLAERYELHQKKQSYIDELRNHLKQGSKAELNELREHLKKNPSRNGVLERLLKEEFPK